MKRVFEKIAASSSSKISSFTLGLALIIGVAVPKAMAQVDLAESVIEPVLEAAEFRPWIVTLHYSYLDFILPGKMGGSIARRDSDRSMWEFEYTHGSLVPLFIDDIGKFTEDRFSLMRRLTGENGVGFQFYYGAFYQRFKLQIGDALISRLSNGTYPSADVLSISGVGAMVGVGYRWLVKEKFVIGIDAVTWSQPLFTTSREAAFLDAATNQSDRDKVETALRVMQYLPRFAVAKVVLGYNF